MQIMKVLLRKYNYLKNIESKYIKFNILFVAVDLYTCNVQEDARNGFFDIFQMITFP